MATSACTFSGLGHSRRICSLDSLLLLFEPVALLSWGMIALALVALRSSAMQRWLVAIYGGIYLLFATPVGANVMVWPLETAAARAAADCHPEASPALFVILAGGSAEGALNSGDLQFLREPSYRRLLYALQLVRTLPDFHLLLSGGFGDRVKEADMLASLAAETGIPPERISLDRVSKNTADSAREAARLAGMHHWGQLFLVTSSLHMPRALAEFRAAGLEPCARPTDSQYVQANWPGYLIPQLSALTKATLALHEYFGLAAFELNKWLALSAF
jgi:uncharacterized SAM-binding protein YcdF (DUF218 family)